MWFRRSCWSGAWVEIFEQPPSLPWGAFGNNRVTTFLSLGRSVAMYQPSISQHCWPSIYKPWPSDRNISSKHVATVNSVGICYDRLAGALGSSRNHDGNSNGNDNGISHSNSNAYGNALVSGNGSDNGMVHVTKQSHSPLRK